MYSKGFTLLELIIALVLIALLAMVALPTYKDYQRRQLLEIATQSLTDLQQNMRGYYHKKGRYARGKKCGISTPDDEFFNYTCRGRKRWFFLVASNKATPELGKSGSFVYTVNHKGKRQTKKYAGHKVKKPCWLVSVHDC